MAAQPRDPFTRSSDPGPDDPADLAANRAGGLSPAQARRLGGPLVFRLVAPLLAAAAACGSLACLPLVLLVAADSPDAPAGPLAMIGLAVLLVWGIAAAAAAWSAWRPAAALLDLQAGRVEAAQGRLIWKGREYRAQTDRGELRLPPGDERLPGGYRFHCLPRSGYIVSAEPSFLGGADMDPLAELGRALGEVFDFRPEDLSDNRAGRLSPRQSGSQWRQLGRTVVGAAAIAAPLAVLFGGFVPYMTVGRDLLAGEPVPAAAWLPTLCFPAFGLVIAFFALAGLVSRWRDLQAGRVQALEGELAERTITTGSGRSRRTETFFEIDAQRFQVPAAGLQAALSGRRYRLHYLPLSRRVISLEPLGPEPGGQP